MKKYVFTFVAVFSCFAVAWGQEVVVRGMVVDSVSGRALPGVLVHIETLDAGTVTNEAGQFAMAVPEGEVEGKTFSAYLYGYVWKKIHLDAHPQAMLVLLAPEDATAGTGPLDGFLGQKYRTPFVQTLNRMANIILDDWYPVGGPQTNRFDLGRIQPSITYNSAEGVRLRVGAASTSRLSSHVFVKGYGAYGFRDRRFKYRGEVAWAFNRPAYHEDAYPRNNLRLVQENDVYPFGEIHWREKNEGALRTYRLSGRAIPYRRFTELSYERETRHDISGVWWMRASVITPGDNLAFTVLQPEGTSLPLARIRTGETGLTLRYAPGEEYVQQRRKRIPLTLENPVFLFSHTVGSSGFFGGNYAYNRTEVSLQERFLIGNYGRLDAVGEVQKIWGPLPFPLLLYPNHRRNYPVENSAFFTTPALEFVSDEQFTLRTTFVGDRWLFYRVPLFRKLGFRELLSVKTLIGRLNSDNIPTAANGLPVFPSETGQLGRLPYVEASVGITHILGLFRFEFVHRFTYRDSPLAIREKVRVDITL